MIYSASRRTDLPAFYPDYIVGKVTRSRKLEGIVFWTKDLRNFIRHLGLQSVILSYPTIIQFTLTGLAGSCWERNVVPVKQQEDELRELVHILPAGALRWRFDPIIADSSVYSRFTESYDFLLSCGVELDEVTVSFPDSYRKVVQRLGSHGMTLPELTRSDKCEILEQLHVISGLKLKLCCEKDLLGKYYLSPARCVDAELFAKYYDISIKKIVKDSHQRSECGCDLSTDIGSYEMQCRHNCLYCYASSEV